MQKEAAKKLIRDTLEHPFNKEQFTSFIKNLLNRIEDAPFTYRGNLIFDDFKDQVQSLERIGKYQDTDGNKIDILIVQLVRETTLERARASQRKFVAKYLKGSRGGELKDAALVAFVSPDEQDWRFSFVKMEYRIETSDKGRVRVKDEFTPARRFSFLVGKNENSHTAQSRLLPILEDTDRNPTLTNIEDAFSVETVTKEFYDQYRKLFDDIQEALEDLVKKDRAIRADFELKGVDTANFAKKLLGQIVFLYFLQKKGWFGVARNAAWGSGPKNFLRLLLEKSLADYDNFFNDILEPLFYEALAVEREADYYSKFKCKIPFLNGGLFDPLNNYDWVETDILLGNELFSNVVKTKQGDTGTGILDVFDRFNFTVREDEPLEREVAVDPEMLGKVFENLLEVKDRKSQGTYYTPREIVHYMCQESLINYLLVELDEKVSREDAEMLVKYGEAAIENDARVMESGKETKSYRFKLSEKVRQNAELIDAKLANIKVCDPAVGSGAFLVGMMTEIVRSRQALTPFCTKREERASYEFKRNAIQSSLHGVDIDLGAVEIAKLRLWLSLIVDEVNYKQIKPLPNLDYKIMQGNSLLEEYEGIKLVDETFFERQEEQSEVRERMTTEQSRLQREYFELHSSEKLTPIRKAELEKRLRDIESRLKTLSHTSASNQDSFHIFGKTAEQSKADQLLQLHENFFATYNKREKDKLRGKIEHLTWDLIETTLIKQGKTEKLAAVKRFQETNTKPFFLWRLNFAEVFMERSGFDVVIANPPYGAEIPEQQLKSIMSKTRITRNSNSAAIFIDFGVSRFISPRGTVSFIVPKSLLYSERWYSIVDSLLDHTCALVDVEKAFEKVKLEQVVFVYGANTNNTSYFAHKFTDSVFSNSISVPNTVPRKLKAWICDVTKNELDICNRVTERPHWLMSDISETRRGVGLQRDLKKTGHYPVIGGKNILRFGLDGVKGYLSKASLENRKRKLVFMSRPKIVSQDVVAHIQNPSPHILIASYYDQEGTVYGLDTVQNTVLTSSSVIPEYILGLLNSTFVSWYTYRFIYCSAIRTMHFDNYYIGKIPIPSAERRQQEGIAQLVARIVDQTNNSRLHGQETARLQSQLDGMIYKLFGLSAADIAVVEGRSR